MNKSILKRAIDTYGADTEIDKYFEESAELTQALIKTRTYQKAHGGYYTEGIKNAILTEVADVYITLEYIKTLYGISEEDLEHEIDFKLNRLKERLENG